MTGLLVSGALEKPDGSRLRFGDVWAWAFGDPSNDADAIHGRRETIGLATPATTTPPPALEPPKPPPPKPPEDQIQFGDIVSKFAVSFGAAPTPTAKRKVRAERAAALCQQLKGMSATDWIGTVRSQRADAAGNGVLVVDIGSASVGTAISRAVDGTDRTLLARDTGLSSAAAALRQGQSVLFSGAFLPDKLDCMKVANPSVPDAVAAPQFLLRFASLKPVETN